MVLLSFVGKGTINSEQREMILQVEGLHVHARNRMPHARAVFRQAPRMQRNDDNEGTILGFNVEAVVGQPRRDRCRATAAEEIRNVSHQLAPAVETLTLSAYRLEIPEGIDRHHHRVGLKAKTQDWEAKRTKYHSHNGSDADCPRAKMLSRTLFMRGARKRSSTYLCAQVPHTNEENITRRGLLVAASRIISVYV